MPGPLDGPETQRPSTTGPPRAHLDAASQDAGHQLLGDPGVLLAVGHQGEQVWCQRRGRAVLVQGFGQSLVGAHTAHHHRAVLAGSAQAVQEANDLLQHLWSSSREQPGPTAAAAAAAGGAAALHPLHPDTSPAALEPGEARPGQCQQPGHNHSCRSPPLLLHCPQQAWLLPVARPAQRPSTSLWAPHLPVAAVGAQGGHTGLHTLVPGQHILLVTVQDLVQDPGRHRGLTQATAHRQWVVSEAALLPCPSAMPTAHRDWKP